MRLSLMLLLSAACSSDPNAAFLYAGNLDADTEGVRLLDDGTGWAGMMDQLCHFDIQRGEVTGEADLGEGHEVLLDAWAGATLARRDTRLIRLDAADQPVIDVGLDVLDARLTHDGLAALVETEGACAVAWLPEGGSPFGYEVPEAACGDHVAFAVDRATSTAWVADGASLIRIAADGTYTRHPAASTDLVAFDPTSGHALVGARGGRWVQAVNADGAVAWSRDLSAPLVDLDAAGDSGIIGFVAEVDRGADLEILDGATGEPNAVYGLPERADIQFSGDGRWLGLVVPDQVHLYQVDPDVRLMDTPGVSRAGSVNPWVGPSGAGAGGSAILGVAVAVAILVD